MVGTYETNISTKESPPDACARFPFAYAEQARPKGTQATDVQGPRPTDRVAAHNAAGKPVAKNGGLCGSVVGGSVEGRQALRSQGTSQRPESNSIRLFGKQAHRECGRSQSSETPPSRGDAGNGSGGRIRYRDRRPQRILRCRIRENRTFNSQPAQALRRTSASRGRCVDEQSSWH